MQTAISKAMVKFPSKLLFQVPLQIYRAAKKVETCDGNSQKFSLVPSSFQRSHFGSKFPQRFFPPLNLNQKSCPPFCFSPLKFQNLSPTLFFVVHPLIFDIQVPLTQSFQLMYNWFVQTDYQRVKHLCYKL